MEKQNQLSGLAKYAWFVLAYTIVVILWGAFVRATGSGAGCGSHWPTCNGDVIPRPESIETWIELSHRLTSAFLGFLVIGLVVWAWRQRLRQSRRKEKLRGVCDSCLEYPLFD